MPKPYHTPKGERVKVALAAIERDCARPRDCYDCGRELPAMGWRSLCAICARDRAENAELEAYLELRDIGN